MQGKVDNVITEVDKFKVVDKAMGDLNSKVDIEVHNIKKDFEQRWSLMASTIDGLTKNMADIRNNLAGLQTNGNVSHSNTSGPRSILQDKAISNLVN